MCARAWVLNVRGRVYHVFRCNRSCMCWPQQHPIPNIQGSPPK